MTAWTTSRRVNVARSTREPSTTARVSARVRHATRWAPIAASTTAAGSQPASRASAAHRSYRLTVGICSCALGRHRRALRGDQARPFVRFQCSAERLLELGDLHPSGGFDFGAAGAEACQQGPGHAGQFGLAVLTHRTPHHPEAAGELGPQPGLVEHPGGLGFLEEGAPV